MNLFALAKEQVIAALEGLVPADLDRSKIAVDQPRDPSHGDLATNAALLMAKPAGLNPRALAATLAERLAAWSLVETAAVAGPGFINLRLRPAAWHEVLTAIHGLGERYGLR